MKFFVKVLPLILIIIYLSAISAQAEQTKAGDLKIEPYVFENYKKEKVDGEFGRLLVPENRTNPRSRFIELHVHQTVGAPRRRRAVNQSFQGRHATLHSTVGQDVTRA